MNDGEPFLKNSFKLPKGYSEAGIHRTDSIVGKRDKKDKTVNGRQNNILKTKNIGTRTQLKTSIIYTLNAYTAILLNVIKLRYHTTEEIINILLFYIMT